MNSDHVVTIREALEFRKRKTIEFADFAPKEAEEELAELNAALAALDEAAGWEMLPDGIEYIEGGDNYLTASLGGSLLSIIRSDLDEPDMDEECDTHSIQLDPNKYRLFRKRQPVQESDA